MNINLRFNLKFPKLKKFFKQSIQTQKTGKPLYKLFSDKPVCVGSSSGALDRRSVAKKISYAIDTSDANLNFLITGEWGIGKSSFLKEIERDLKRLNIRFLWFSPWKYSKSQEGPNSISRAFLTTLSNGFGKSLELNDLYLKKQVENEKNLFAQIIILLQIIFNYIVYTGVIFGVFFLVSKIPHFSGIYSQILNHLRLNSLQLSALLALPPLGEYFMQKIREKGEIEKISSPELIEKKFKSLMYLTIKIPIIQTILSKWESIFEGTFLYFLGKPLTKVIFYNGILSSLKLEKIVVFADDLDRCEEGEVREFLTGMKTFLDDDKIFYIIAADIEKLRGKADSQEPDFLNKIVQIDWAVPNLDQTQREQLIKILLKEAGAAEDLLNINQAAYLFQATQNPRKIKYYLRRLLFLLNCENKNE